MVTAQAYSTAPPTCTAPTPAAISVDEEIALDKLPPGGAAVAGAAAVPAAGVAPPLLTLLLMQLAGAAPAAAARAAARAAASRPAAAATELVVTDSSGTLKSLVVVLNTDRATPTPASCVAPAQYQKMHMSAVSVHQYTH